jgi:hypothetical protein
VSGLKPEKGERIPNERTGRRMSKVWQTGTAADIATLRAAIRFK